MPRWFQRSVRGIWDEIGTWSPDWAYLAPMAKSMGLGADELLDQLWESKGTDLLLTPGVSPMVRVDGDLSRMEGYGPLGPADTERIMRQLMTGDQAALFGTGVEVDFSFTWRDQARRRGNAFRTKGDVGLSLRLIPHAI